jgi:hypothetical protein
MAASIKQGITPVSNMYGPNNNPVWHGIEAASQSWKAGMPLINSSGSLAIAATLPTLGTVIGISIAAATGVTGADVPFTPILNGMLWEITLDVLSSTTVTGTGTVAQTDFWNKFNLSLDTVGVNFYLNQASSSAGGLLLVGVKRGVVLGTTVQPRVYVTFPSYALAAGNLGLSIY